MSIFIFFRQISTNEIAGSYIICILNYLRNYLSLFHSDLSILHSHQEGIRVLISLYPLQYPFLVFWIVAILPGMRWYEIMVLICISLVRGWTLFDVCWPPVVFFFLRSDLFSTSACFMFLSYFHILLSNLWYFLN